jgi:hypothetical protein
VREKGNSKIDLVTDLFLENRQFVTEKDWENAARIVKAVSQKLSEGTRLAKGFPCEKLAIRDCTEFIGSTLTLDNPTEHRLIVDRLQLKTNVDGSIAILAEGFESKRSFAGTAILIGGNNGPREKRNVRIGETFRSFVYSDGDIAAAGLYSCIVIASGKIVSDQGASVIVEGARKSARIKLFSVSDLGLQMAQNEKTLALESVAPGSLAEKSGFKTGDIIIRPASFDDLNRSVRRIYAGAGTMEIVVRRQGRDHSLTLRFDD